MIFFIRMKRAASYPDGKLPKSSTKKKILITIVVTAAVIVGFSTFVASCGYMQASTILRRNDPNNSDAYLPENQTPLENSPLKDKTILFVGSSIVYSFAWKHISFADYPGVLDPANMIKETYSGSTVAQQDETSRSFLLMMRCKEQISVQLQILMILPPLRIPSLLAVWKP